MISFKNVTKKFGEITALENVSFEIEPGEFVFLMGPSGAGKTTIARLILREYLPTEGEIEIAGVNLASVPRKKIPYYRRKIGMIFQDLKLLPDQTVFENIALPLKILKKKEEEIEQKVKETLEQVGLSERANFFPAQLAGGELQRVCIARAIVGDPEIIIADEPTGNLDISTGQQIVDLLEKINQGGKIVIMATHNVEIVKRFKKRIIELDKGKVVADKKKGEK
ncbi:MAG: cell division ATP-binding protein FtsE [Microgenomates group bacterium]